MPLPAANLKSNFPCSTPLVQGGHSQTIWIASAVLSVIVLIFVLFVIQASTRRIDSPVAQGVTSNHRHHAYPKKHGPIMLFP